MSELMQAPKLTREMKLEKSSDVDAAFDAFNEVLDSDPELIVRAIDTMTNERMPQTAIEPDERIDATTEIVNKVLDVTNHGSGIGTDDATWGTIFKYTHHKEALHDYLEYSQEANHIEREIRTRLAELRKLEKTNNDAQIEMRELEELEAVAKNHMERQRIALSRIRGLYALQVIAMETAAIYHTEAPIAA